MSVAQILAHSSNVGAITLAEKLGKDRLSRWIDALRLRPRDRRRLPRREPRASCFRPTQWSGSTIGNVPIGQGIAVTPVQMAAAYAAIANRRRLGAAASRRAHRRQAPAARAQAADRLARRSPRELTRCSQNVVVGRHGHLRRVPGYQVAGKTGTAQKPDAHGGYSTSKYVASFVGFVPASKPRLVILVTVDEPHGQIWGGVVAAPAFAQIAGVRPPVPRGAARQPSERGSG